MRININSPHYNKYDCENYRVGKEADAKKMKSTALNKQTRTLKR